MLYRFTGDEPEQFPTLQFDPSRSCELEPGETVDVAGADDNPGGLVIHPRLDPADDACRAATAELQAWVDGLNSPAGHVVDDDTPAALVGLTADTTEFTVRMDEAKAKLSNVSPAPTEEP